MFLYNIMKSFFISIIFFILLIALISINSMYLTKSTNELKYLIESISNESIETFTATYNAAYDKWRSIRTIAKQSCFYTEISTIDTLFEQLKVYGSEQAIYDFHATKQVMIQNLNELTRLEKAFS